jgi:hypothetical protein
MGRWMPALRGLLARWPSGNARNLVSSALRQARNQLDKAGARAWLWLLAVADPGRRGRPGFRPPRSPSALAMTGRLWSLDPAPFGRLPPWACPCCRVLTTHAHVNLFAVSPARSKRARWFVGQRGPTTTTQDYQIFAQILPGDRSGALNSDGAEVHCYDETDPSKI